MAGMIPWEYRTLKKLWAVLGLLFFLVLLPQGAFAASGTSYQAEGL